MVWVDEATRFILNCDKGILRNLKEQTFEMQLEMCNEELDEKLTLENINEDSFKGILPYDFSEVFEKVLAKRQIEFITLTNGRFEDNEEIHMEDLN